MTNMCKLMLVVFIICCVTVSLTCLVVQPKEVIIPAAENGKTYQAEFGCYNETDSNHTIQLQEPNCIVSWIKDSGYQLIHSVKHRIRGTRGHLFINRVEWSDSGVYQCVCVHCITGTIENAFATLWVAPKVTAPTHQTTTVGYKGYIYCNITNTTYMRWYKDDDIITEWRIGRKGPKKLISNYVSSVGNGTLTIRDVKMDSNGRYRCTAGNKAGESSKEFIVFLKWPMPVSQQIGTPCQRWKRDEGDKEDVPLRVKRERVPILTATEVLAAEAYWSEKEKKMREHPPVVIKAPPTCVLERSKKRLELPCRAVGYPIPTITWTKNDSRGFSRDSVYHTYIHADSHKLTIKRLDYSDRGIYTCHISNRLGSHVFHVRLEVDDLKVSCGTLHDSVREKRISGGEKTGSISQWPWQAIVSYNPAVWPYQDSFCGGSIIDRTTILTAYHCTITSLVTHNFFQPQDVIVTLGVYNRSLAYETTRQVFSVKTMYRIFGSEISRDLSILVLHKEIVFSNYIRPICLPGLSETIPEPGTECVVSGYGWTANHGPPSDVLQRVTVPLISWSKCKDHFYFISDETVCTESGDVRSTCPGDSGGPLVCRRNSTGQWVQMGVVSGGDCPGGVNYFANVVQNRYWIKNPLN